MCAGQHESRVTQSLLVERAFPTRASAGEAARRSSAAGGVDGEVTKAERPRQTWARDPRDESQDSPPRHAVRNHRPVGRAIATLTVSAFLESSTRSACPRGGLFKARGRGNGMVCVRPGLFLLQEVLRAPCSRMRCAFGWHRSPSVEEQTRRDRSRHVATRCLLDETLCASRPPEQIAAHSLRARGTLVRVLQLNVRGCTDSVMPRLVLESTGYSAVRTRRPREP